jgi:hypothetical protein
VRFVLRHVLGHAFDYLDKKITRFAVRKAGPETLESQEYREYREAMDNLRVTVLGKKPRRKR